MKRKELTKTFMMISNWKQSLFFKFVHKYFSDLKVNPCAAGTVYVRFLASLKPNKIPLKIINLFVIYDQRDAQRCTDHQILQFDTRPFFINEHIFRPLKLEISISALNQWEIETNNSVAQGLLSTYTWDVLVPLVCILNQRKRLPWLNYGQIRGYEYSDLRIYQIPFFLLDLQVCILYFCPRKL